MSCEDVLAFEDRRADRALESELFLGRGDCAREEGEGKDSWCYEHCVWVVDV